MTSGPLSPQLLGRSSSLGFGFVSSAHAQDNDVFEIDVRGDRYSARIVAYPFCERRVRDDAHVLTHSPYDLMFSENHLWVRNEKDGRVTVGLSDFGQRDLGEVLFVSLPNTGSQVSRGAGLGWLDTYRRPFDLTAPVSGTVVSVNASAIEQPSDVNRFPYARTGLVQLVPSDPDELKDLIEFPAYMDIVRKLESYETWSQDLRLT